MGPLGREIRSLLQRRFFSPKKQARPSRMVHVCPVLHWSCGSWSFSHFASSSASAYDFVGNFVPSLNRCSIVRFQNSMLVGAKTRSDCSDLQNVPEIIHCHSKPIKDPLNLCQLAITHWKDIIKAQRKATTIPTWEVCLNSLSEQHLRLLAHALEETQRCCPWADEGDGSENGRWVPQFKAITHGEWEKMMETFRVIDVWPHLWCDVIARSSSWSDNPLGIFQRGAATFSVPCKLTQSKNQWKIPSCPKILAFPHVPQSVHSVHVRQFTPVYPEAISSACTRRPPRWNAISPSPRVETQRCHGASWYCWDDHPTDTGHPGDMVKLKRSKNEKMGRSWKVPSSTSIYFRMITNHNMRKMIAEFLMKTV